VNRILALWETTVGKKVAMAATGIILILFLISHMISNVLIFRDPQHLDSYARLLRSLGPLLWVFRAGLLAAVLIHGVAAWQLTRRAHGARPGAYGRHELQVADYAARTMRWGGVLLVVFIVFHLMHFTLGVFSATAIQPEFHPGEVGRNVIEGMAVKPVALFYLVAMAALGLHLWHGSWSVFQTLGVSHPAWNRTRKGVAVVLAIAVAGGFAAIPLAALLGWLR
jgi:succinate dehydrogenase / fumarate reductase cytochrome b subunit